MLTHTLLRRSTAAVIVTALMAAVYSLSVAQGVPLENKWLPVVPQLLPADMVGKGIEIKVGRSYKLVNYDAVEQAKLGLQYFLEPREANAKRVLTIYDLSKFSLKDWMTIDQATPPDEDPPLAAFLVPAGNEAYIGTPFKWNNQIGDTMRAAVSLEEKHPKIKASETLKILADDLVSLAANSQALPMLQGKVSGPTWEETVANFKRAGIKYDVVATGWTPEELQSMKAGNPAPMMAKQPNKRIYMAFDREFEHLSVEPLGRVISVSGVGGQRLGHTQAAWPNEKSD